MEKYAYVRVSSKEQNEDRQINALKNIGIELDHIFIDKKSGKDFNRPNYLRLLNLLQPNDCLYIHSIDRLGRNYVEIIEQWKVITKEKKVDIIVIDMPLLDTTTCKDLLGTFISDLVLQILSFVAENERNNIKQRQKEGIEAAKLRGVKFGRPKKMVDENTIIAYINKEISIEEIVKNREIAKSTFYKRLNEYKNSL